MQDAFILSCSSCGLWGKPVASFMWLDIVFLPNVQKNEYLGLQLCWMNLTSLICNFIRFHVRLVFLFCVLLNNTSKQKCVFDDFCICVLFFILCSICYRCCSHLAVLQCHPVSHCNHLLHNMVVYSLCGWILLSDLCPTWNWYLW